MNNNIKITTYLKFLIATILVGSIFVLSGFINELFNLGGYTDIILKILLVILLCVYAKKHDDFNSFFNIDFPPVYLAIIIIPLIFSIILQICPLDFEPYPEFVVLTVVGTLLTAIWEELFFRYWGCSLFEQNGRYKWYNIIFLAFAFSLCHMANMFFDAWYTTLTQLFFTFGLGIFLLALYIHTKAIIVPIIAHFCINSVSDFFVLFATEEARAMAYVGNSELILAIYVIVFIVMGIYILKKHDHIG